MDALSVDEVRRVSRTGVERSVRATTIGRDREVPERQRERIAWIGRVVDPSLLRREPGARRDAGRRDREREQVRRRAQAERMREVLELLAQLRVVSYRSVADAAFDGHPHTARRGIGALEEQGLIERRSIKPIGSKRNGPAKSFQVLALTEKGAAACERQRREAGEPGGRVWSGFVRPRELAHDAAVSDLVLSVGERVEACGGAVRGVRMEAELKGALARAEEAAGGDRGARRKARVAAAAALGVWEVDGEIHLPDAVVEVTDDGGREMGIQVEVATGKYSAAQVQAKLQAGMVVAFAGATRSFARRMERAVVRMAMSSKRIPGRRPGEFQERLFEVGRVR